MAVADLGIPAALEFFVRVPSFCIHPEGCYYHQLVALKGGWGKEVISFIHHPTLTHFFTSILYFQNPILFLFPQLVLCLFVSYFVFNTFYVHMNSLFYFLCNFAKNFPNSCKIWKLIVHTDRFLLVLQFIQIIISLKYWLFFSKVNICLS